nr:hypothetical protein TetV2_00022 [Oceanusvirus sp.]
MSLRQTLEDKLLFPLPTTDALRSNEDPVIQSDHPMYDYYEEKNWGATGGISDGTVNRVIIMPSGISAPHAGLFKPQTYAPAVTKAVEQSWSEISLGDENESAESLQAKLQAFVLSVAVKHCQTTVYTEFDYSVADEPDSFLGVFPCSKPTPYCSEDSVPDDIDSAKAHHRSSSAYKRLETKYASRAPDSFNGHDNTADALFDAMRIYWAFRVIDEIFEKVDEYFFLQRLVLITKILFVARLLRMTNSNEQYQQLMSWVYIDNLKYAVVDHSTETEALDDMFQANVRSSHDIKENSALLQETKARVGTAQDNLQSLSSSDTLVTRQRRNSVILFWVMVALLVLQIGSLSLAHFANSNLIAYVVIVSVAGVALGLEMTRTLKTLINF